MSIFSTRRLIAIALLTAALSATSNVVVASGVTPENGEVVFTRPHDISSDFDGTAQYIVHYMPSVTGEMTRASTLLLVPNGEAPDGGWPVIAWAHGTTTPGDKRCAPSVTKDLDGGMTRDGFTSDYLFQMASLVNAGYAVVAPDFEGLGDVASVPLPYFNAGSLSRSLISGVIAAHEVNADLSARYASVGHSDGGHAVLGMERFVGDAPQFDYLGTVALAPYAAIEATVTELADRAKSDSDNARSLMAMANFHVGLMAAGLSVVDPSFDPASIMGTDLLNVFEDFKTQCSMGVNIELAEAVNAKSDAFEGYKADWASNPKMAAFLQENDVAVAPNFHLEKPTLITVGTSDPFIFNNLTRHLVASLQADGAPITYEEYPGDDHFTILRKGEGEVLTFLNSLFAN